MAPQPRLDPNSTYPVTPTKPRLNIAEFDIWFLEFSNTYNLNLRRSPPDLSPHKKRSLPYYPELQYYELLKVQYFKGKHELIQDLFAQGAKAIYSKWIKKPRAEPGVTPFPSQLPRATSEPERCELLTLLKAILEDIGSVNVSRRSSVVTSVSYQVYDEPLSSARDQRSKRYSDGWRGSPSPKRNRSVPSDIDTECDPDDERPPSVLSTLDRGRVLTASPAPSQLSSIQAPNLSRLSRNGDPYKAEITPNTSKSTFASRVFSDHDDNQPLLVSQQTQTTVMASNPESIKPYPFPPSLAIGSDSDSFAPSSGTERALQISFDRHELLQQNMREFLKNGSSTYSDFDYSEQETTRPATPSPPSHMRPTDPLPAIQRPASPTVSPPLSPEGEKLTSAPPREVYGNSQGFEHRLHDVWAHLPDHYDRSPFVVRWEILRIALHCQVRMEDLRIEYDPSWTDQRTLWARLRALPVFQGKSFPEKTRPEAWKAALNDEFATRDQVVVLTASLTANPSKNGPPFLLKLNPLKLDLPHRLSRRFGSDRFLELVIPSLSSQDVRRFGESAIESIQRWLIDGPHVLLGRVWTAFFLKEALPKKISNENAPGPQSKTVHQERIYLFAEDGNDFRRPATGASCSPKGEPVDMHTRMSRGELIDWLLQVPNNQTQPVLKLFQRITLGLSRTHPTVVLRPEQIRHQPEDILSPINKVMNDGIARMSYGLARAIRDMMGFWIRDTTDTSDTIWIETRPSQRKWNCDYIEDDHRTFEVLSESREIKSASLNLQLLPILEDRAINATQMKIQVGNFMKDSLKRDLDAQKAAMQDPTQFRLWVYENSPTSRRMERTKHCQVPFTAGLPNSREDIMAFLLDSGFDPTKLQFLSEIAWNLRVEKCQELKERLHVRVGRSTYAYMVVDFLGILEEDEVHLGFSSKFTDEHSGFSETFLHGIDVLVARTPAHYPSDIQRVKAVFKPELGSLKDVIIFSTKGNIPLAEKLSGGDYDGDTAWVCWEPTIVNNFHNADMPDAPDLFQQGVIRKETLTYRDLAGASDITSKFLLRAFKFNLQQNLLGMCTNYKEKLCYTRNSVQDESAILLSTLISNLVDRAKQGIIFTDQDWARLRKRISRFDPPDPQYKKNSWSLQGKPTHIIDFVKFGVGQPIVEEELKTFQESLNQAELYDKDLVRYYQYYEKFQRPFTERKEAVKKLTWERVLEKLRKDIDVVAQEWPNRRGEWDAKLTSLYDKWQEIKPTDEVKSDTVKSLLLQEDQAKVGLSSWDLLKASFAFGMYYNKYPKFVWYIAGKQLAYLKATYSSQEAGAPPVLMTPGMYAGSRPDNRYARVLAARSEGRNLVESEAIDEETATSLSDGEV
ncbi:RNA dependent RNA polymerase-domain-containing protein [Daldinia caldariorum]|uniref:RNA dependent RNA polymerase-domain-containing protein n=1 Tax=Daldinia caldariorum TaxID=326644 RepID=UPI0020089DB6|nr:RNA dependent RNA polymerase-domain-containing protein [Daldinia caldariorum]KAI1467082.1 RNA dependent RNA polymerase-domain-containing protein [Daldinia caldariorum]